MSAKNFIWETNIYATTDHEMQEFVKRQGKESNTKTNSATSTSTGIFSFKKL